MTISLIAIRSRVVLKRMLAGVSTRRYRRTQERWRAGRAAGAVDVEVLGLSDVRRTHARALGELRARQLSDLLLAVMMLDGLELKGRMMILALGITTEGVKIPLGLWEGSTETRPSRPRCSLTSSSAGWTPSKGCCLCSRLYVTARLVWCTAPCTIPAMGLFITVETALNEWLAAMDAEAWDTVADGLDDDVQLADELTTQWLRGRDRVGAYLRASQGIVTEIVSTPSALSVSELGSDSALVTFTLHQRYLLGGEPRNEHSTGCAAFSVRGERVTLSLFHLAPVRTATETADDLPEDGLPAPVTVPAVPDAAIAPAVVDDAFVLGEEIRRRRTAARLSLRELAERTGLSASFLSQIERSRADLSVSSLRQVASGLGVDVVVLLGRQRDGSLSGLREGLDGQRPRFFVRAAGVTVEGFRGFDDGRLEAYIVEPASGHGGEVIAGSDGEEFLYVIGGRVEVVLEQRSVVLEAGDGAHVRPGTPHRVTSAGQAPARYLVVQSRGAA